MSVISRLPHKTQLIIFGVLIVALCAVYYSYMISPVRTELVAVEADIDRLAAEVEEGQRLATQLAELKKTVSEQSARLERLKQVLPDRKETAEIIRQVHDLAVKSDLAIKSFTPRKTVNHGFYEEWPILISLEGTYNNLGGFFEQIAAFTRLINVYDISILALEEGVTDKRTLTATCTATTFVQLASGAAPATQE